MDLIHASYVIQMNDSIKEYLISWNEDLMKLRNNDHLEKIRSLSVTYSTYCYSCRRYHIDTDFFGLQMMELQRSLNPPFRSCGYNYQSRYQCAYRRKSWIKWLFTKTCTLYVFLCLHCKIFGKSLCLYRCIMHTK